MNRRLARCNRMVGTLLAAMMLISSPTTAWPDPQDQMFFSDFEGIVPNTQVGQPFDVGEGGTVATLGGDAFAGIIGLTQLYHSGVKAWMVNPQGTGTITFSTSAAAVEFFARTNSSANGNTVITAFDDSGNLIGDPIMIGLADGWQLISLTGSIERIEVENLASGSNRINAIDDFGFTPVEELPLLAGDYNGNGTVKQADLDLVLLNWGAEGSTPPSGWINDLPSGTIDQAELDRVLLGWGNTNMPAASAIAFPLGSASVPEPSTSLTFVTAGIAALRLRWRKRRSIPWIARRSKQAASCLGSNRCRTGRNPAGTPAHRRGL